MRNYQVFRGKVSHFHRECSDDETPHFQLFLYVGDQVIRCPVNVHSRVDPPDLVFFLDHNFQHKILPTLTMLNVGFTPIAPEDHQGLDYLRDPLFDLTQVQSLPACQSGGHDDLQDVLEGLAQEAKQMQSDVFVFGEAFGKPPIGIHDIHMNQGSSGRFASENGIFQDGGVFFHRPAKKCWTALFLAFQSQATQTDDAGDPIHGTPTFADILRHEATTA